MMVHSALSLQRIIDGKVNRKVDILILGDLWFSLNNRLA
jgi:hypothetical protein